MVGEQNLLAVDRQLRLQRARDPELVEHPSNHRFTKHLQRLWIGLQDAGQDAVELAERLLEKNHVIQIPAIDACLAQAELDGIGGEIKVVLLAGKSLFFG